MTAPDQCVYCWDRIHPTDDGDWASDDGHVMCAEAEPLSHEPILAGVDVAIIISQSDPAYVG